VDPAGRIDTVFRAEPGHELVDFSVAPDGTLYVAAPAAGGRLAVSVLGAGGAAPTPVTDEAASNCALASGPAGELELAFLPAGKVVRWTAANGPTTTLTDARRLGAVTSLAADPNGRLYFSTSGKVLRYDPDQDGLQTVAGPGGKFFTGSGVDDGLHGPRALVFDAAGNLYFADTGHRQVKRIAAGEL
jgi:glucose/arabinose dehydrogenase